MLDLGVCLDLLEKQYGTTKYDVKVECAVEGNRDLAMAFKVMKKDAEGQGDRGGEVETGGFSCVDMAKDDNVASPRSDCFLNSLLRTLDVILRCTVTRKCLRTSSRLGTGSKGHQA